MAISPALPRPGAHAWPMDRLPDPEVAERPTRRRFTAAYKVAILDELDRATTPGSKGAILRREGLYSSHVTDWRRLRRSGASRPWAGREAPRPPIRWSPRTSACGPRWVDSKRGSHGPRR